MRNIWFLVIKEFRQTFRDPAILRMIFIMPALQLLILPFAADYEIKNIDIAIVDYDRSAVSARLANKLAHSGYFHLVGHARSNAEGMRWVGEDKADMFVEIPLGFAKNWVARDEASLSLVVNAVLLLLTAQLATALGVNFTISSFFSAVLGSSANPAS